MHMPFFHNLAILQIHAIKCMLVFWIHQHHVCVLIMEHDALGRKGASLGRANPIDGCGKLEGVVICVLEHTNLVATYDKRPVRLVSDGQSRVALATHVGHHRRIICLCGSFDIVLISGIIVFIIVFIHRIELSLDGICITILVITKR